MRFLLHACAVGIGLILVLAVHLGVGIFLSHPFNHINVFVGAAVWLFLVRSTGAAVWWFFGLYFVLELFASTPFGILLGAGTFSVLFLYWLSRSVITNRSWMAAVGLSVMGVVFFRLLHVVCLLCVSWISGSPYVLTHVYMQGVAWEIVLTTGVTTASILLLRRFIPSLDTKHIRLRV